MPRISWFLRDWLAASNTARADATIASPGPQPRGRRAPHGCGCGSGPRRCGSPPQGHPAAGRHGGVGHRGGRGLRLGFRLEVGRVSRLGMEEAGIGGEAVGSIQRSREEERRRSRGLEGWRGSIHMNLAGQRAAEVVRIGGDRSIWISLDRGRCRWRRPGRSGALGFERERRAGGVGWGSRERSARCGLGAWVRQAGRWIQEHPTVIRHDPREMFLDQSERSIPVLYFFTI